MLDIIVLFLMIKEEEASAQIYHQNDASEGNTKVTFAGINFIIVMMKHRTGNKSPPAVSTNSKTHPRGEKKNNKKSNHH